MSLDPRLSALLLILTAPAVGSFLGVLVDRLPRDEDVFRRGSACRGCGQRLSVLDLIPILSFALSKGRCRHCGASFAPWHLYIEITALGMAVLTVAAGKTGAGLWLDALFLWILLALFFTDLIWMRLPDSLTAALFLVAMAAALLPGGQGGQTALLGAALGCGSFAALRFGYRALRGREGLGLGDVKLMAGLGAFAGPIHLPLMVLMASGGALALVVVLHGLRGNGTPAGTMRIPFGSALCLAGATLWVLRAGAVPLP